MMAERIAAIITCHDLGRTLAEALASVERQTRPASEIVLVDDASTRIYTQQVLARTGARWHTSRAGWRPRSLRGSQPGGAAHIGRIPRVARCG